MSRRRVVKNSAPLHSPDGEQPRRSIAPPSPTNTNVRGNPVKAADKVTLKNTRDGLVEHNTATGEDVRVSKREADFDLRGEAPGRETLSQVGNSSNKDKKRKQQYRQRRSDDALEPKSETTATAKHPPAPRPSEHEPLRAEALVPEQAESISPEVGVVAPDKKPVQSKPTQSKQRKNRQAPENVTEQTAAPDAPSASEQPAKSGRLQFSPDETTPDTPKIHHNRKLSKAQAQVERTTSKLDKAQKKLPKKRKLRSKRVLDEKSGTAKRKLYFEPEVKTQGQHLKGPLPLRPVKAAGNSALAFGHRKMYQVQHENVGTEAAHKGEMAVEGIARTALRHHKTAPYRKVAKLERKSVKKSINLSYQKAIAENPKLKSNLVSRAWQKRKIKKDYAKAAREAKKAAKQAKKAGSVAADAGKAVVAAVRRHPIAAAVIVLVALLLFMLMSLIGAFGGMGSGGLGGILTASYLAEDTDIENAELSYTEWEMDLQMQIASVETDRPGYDEYSYQIDNIGHNPYELMAYLTVKYQNFTYGAIEADLLALFNEQYTLTFTPTTETRYADPNDDDGDGDYEPYEWRILTVTLTARSFSDVAFFRLSGEEYAHYALLLQTKGSRQLFGNPFDIGWLSRVTSNYGYRVHPISGEKNLHRGVDIGLPTGTEIRSCQDGTVTFAGWSDSYGNYVVIENTEGLMSKYAHCDSLLVSAGQTVSMGDVIATVGNTGNSTGPHLHLEVLKDGAYLNPLYFVDTGSFDLTPSYGYAGAAMGDGTYAAMMAEAEKYIGYPYVYGGSSPSTSFDCSGMVCYVINQSGVGSVGRTTAQGLYNLSTPVSPSEAQPGDLIFFHSTYSHYEHITHVAIYCGGTSMFHAGNPIGYASFDTAYWQEHFFAFARLPEN